MSAYLTSSTLIASIKRRALIPTSQNTFTDDDFLAFANEELSIGLLPSVLMYHEEYFVFSEEVPLLPSISEYPIPYRAIGGRLRNLQYRDVNLNIRELSRISPDDQQYFSPTTMSTDIFRFFVKGNSIILVPNLTAGVTGNLVFSYFFRPNQLVKESRVATIVSIDRATGIVGIDKLPSNIEAGDLVDLLETKPGHKIYDYDVLPTGVDSIAKTIAFNVADIPAGLLVGDVIALAGECIIPQVPTELHSVLAQRAANRCLEALGDTQGLSNGAARLQEMEVKTGNLVDNRVEGAPLKAINFRGPLRAAKLRRRGF